MFVFRVAVIIISVCCFSTNFVFINKKLTWTQAQNYCRVHFTDLLPIDTGFANHQFRKKVRSHNSTGWIGLYKNPLTGWRWSGGGPVTFRNWKYLANDLVAYWTVKGWRSVKENLPLNFYCYKLIVVGERKSWEDALESCNQNFTSLTSVASKTHRLLAKTTIQQKDITDPVWVGLRFLSNSWIWMNKDPSSYHAWPQASQDHLCPVKGRCGALTKEGRWENRDCEEKLNFLCS